MLGLVLSLLILLIVLAALLFVGSRSETGFERIARCRAGHLFMSTVIPGSSLKAVRLGRVRFQRCPVGNHWTLVGEMRATDLAPQELAQAHSHHDVHIP